MLGGRAGEGEDLPVPPRLGTSIKKAVSRAATGWNARREHVSHLLHTRTTEHSQRQDESVELLATPHSAPRGATIPSFWTRIATNGFDPLVKPVVGDFLVARIAPPPEGFGSGSVRSPVHREDLRRLSKDGHVEETWAKIQTHLRAALPESVYQIWLSTLEPVGIDEHTLYLRVQPEIQDWVKRRFGSTLRKAASKERPSLRRVELISSDVDIGAGTDVRAGTTAQSDPSWLDRSALRPEHTFAHFVIGRSNRFAHAAALAAAEMPGHAYNPLFIHGPSGVGKTHLLQAIGDYAITQGTAAKRARPGIHYTTVEAFTNQFLAALQRNDLHAFKERQRRNDILLIDDVQFLEGKEKTAEEFFHTFDAAISSGAQVALSGDRHPSEMPLLQTGLRERLQEGLIVDLSPPDLDTRLAILRVRARFNGISIDSNDVLHQIATRVPGNIRILEGALIRVAAFASLTDSKLTIEVVDRVLGHLYDSSVSDLDRPSNRPTVIAIQEATSEALKVDKVELSSSRRSRHVVYARQIAMYLCRELTDLSLPAIALQFGGRDHTTVLHAYRKVQKEIHTNRDTYTLVISLKQAIQSASTGKPQPNL
jgi:chromosomal replication initiator protein